MLRMDRTQNVEIRMDGKEMIMKYKEGTEMVRTCTVNRR